MKRFFIASALAPVALTGHAENDSTERWFGDYDTPETRQAYELTKKHPELCSKMFP
jgi:hypothetical protein